MNSIQTKIQFMQRYFLHLLIIVFAISVVSATWNMQPQVDSIGARNSFRSQNPNDLFGAFPTWYFGMLPDGTLTWFQKARLIQILLVLIASVIVLSMAHFRTHISVLAMSTALIFVTNVNRDSFGLSFLILGTAISLRLRVKETSISSKMSSLLLVGSMCLAFMMRPYFAFVSIPLLLSFFVNIKMIYRLLLIFTILFAPLVLNKFISQEMNLGKSFPSQQPIAQDLSYLACQTNNLNVQIKALKVLRIANVNLNASQLCKLTSIHSGFLISGDPWKSAPPAFQLFTESRENYFNRFQTEYIKLVITRPDLFIKVKMHNFIELLFAKGQMQHLEPLTVSNNIFVMSTSKFLLYLDKLGCFTVLFMSLMVFYFWLRNKRQLNSDKRVIPVLLSAALSITGFSVIYVGAIGRYTYITFILLFLCMSYFLQARQDDKSKEELVFEVKRWSS